MNYSIVLQKSTCGWLEQFFTYQVLCYDHCFVPNHWNRKPFFWRFSLKKAPFAFVSKLQACFLVYNIVCDYYIIGFNRENFGPLLLHSYLKKQCLVRRVYILCWRKIQGMHLISRVINEIIAIYFKLISNTQISMARDANMWLKTVSWTVSFM